MCIGPPPGEPAARARQGDGPCHFSSPHSIPRLPCCVRCPQVTHQKGCDLIAYAAAAILRARPEAQLAVVGPVGDEYGETAQRVLAAGGCVVPC